jgi:hypothetical protein
LRAGTGGFRPARKDGERLDSCLVLLLIGVKRREVLGFVDPPRKRRRRGLSNHSVSEDIALKGELGPLLLVSVRRRKALGLLVGIQRRFPSASSVKKWVVISLPPSSPLGRSREGLGLHHDAVIPCGGIMVQSLNICCLFKL